MGQSIREVIRNSIPSELYYVLKVNKCIDKYVNNVYVHNIANKNINYLRNNSKQRVDTLIKLLRVIPDITVAFAWWKAPEGAAFWNEINNQYLEIMKGSKGIRSIIRENIPLDLYEVLRRNKCITKYIENTYQHGLSYVSKSNYINYQRYLHTLRELCKNRTKHIRTAFSWRDTPEGFSFWESIANQYEKYIEEVK